MFVWSLMEPHEVSTTGKNFLQLQYKHQPVMLFKHESLLQRPAACESITHLFKLLFVSFKQINFSNYTIIWLDSRGPFVSKLVQCRVAPLDIIHTSHVSNEL